MSARPASTLVRRGLVVFAFLLGVLGLGLWLKRPGPEPTLPAAELVRVDGRFMLRSATNRPFTGWMTEVYPDSGSPRSRSHLTDGRLHGVSEGWHPGGALQVREHFVTGVAEGPVTKWHPNGARLSEGTARAGKLEGVFRRWHDNGMLAEEVTLQHGQPHGLSRAWFPSGSLKAEVTLAAGEVVKQQFWKDGEQPALAATNTNPDPP